MQLKRRFRPNQAAGSQAAGQQSPPEAPLVKLSNEGRAQIKWAGATRPLRSAASGSYLCMFAHSSPDNNTFHAQTREERKKKRQNGAARLAQNHESIKRRVVIVRKKKHVEICASLHFRTVCFAAFFPLCLFEEGALSARRTTRLPRCDERQPGHLPGSVSGETQDNKPDFAPGRGKTAARR